MINTDSTMKSLSDRHVQGAVLFANRYDMIVSLGKDKKIIAEIGVAQGDFSVFILTELQPTLFIAIDLFEMHTSPVHWGIPQEVMFNNLTHQEFYTHRMSKYSPHVRIYRGYSHECLAELADDSVDLIYVDASHDYENVKRDMIIAIKKLSPDGLLIFNDYIMYDPFLNIPYGVVKAVNELLLIGDWKVKGFALEQNMFCDVALARAGAGGT